MTISTAGPQSSGIPTYTAPTSEQIIAAAKKLKLDNYNEITASRFAIQFSKSPELIYFANSVNIPDLSLAMVNQPTGAGVDLKLPGDKLEFSDLTIGFTVDEDLKVWRDLVDYMYELCPPENAGDYVRQNKNAYDSDIHVISLTNKSNPNYVITFHSAFPTSVSSLDFTSSDPSVIMTCSTNFSYDYFTYRSV